MFRFVPIRLPDYFGEEKDASFPVMGVILRGENQFVVMVDLQRK